MKYGNGQFYQKQAGKKEEDTESGSNYPAPNFQELLPEKIMCSYFKLFGMSIIRKEKLLIDKAA
ncbi:hypothetical protein P0Y35_06375 [Kiritimatiellaeota bacterium B1221]|nr:hypothetical protein [Kiritimatiellaeota bacterium B1221]